MIRNEPMLTPAFLSSASFSTLFVFGPIRQQQETTRPSEEPFLQRIKEECMHTDCGDNRRLVKRIQ